MILTKSYISNTFGNMSISENTGLPFQLKDMTRLRELALVALESQDKESCIVLSLTLLAEFCTLYKVTHLVVANLPLTS